MAKTKKRTNERSLLRELASGVEAILEHREGRLTVLNVSHAFVIRSQATGLPSDRAFAIRKLRARGLPRRVAHRAFAVLG